MSIKNVRSSHTAFVLMFLVVLSACSGNNAAEVDLVFDKTSLSIAEIRTISGLNSGGAATSFQADVATSGLIKNQSCYLIHVTAPDMLVPGTEKSDGGADSTTCPASVPKVPGLGKIFGPYAYGSGAKISVPAGASRRFDLIGFINPYEDDPNCSKTWEVNPVPNPNGGSTVVMRYGDYEIDPKTSSTTTLLKPSAPTGKLGVFYMSQLVNLAPGPQSVAMEPVAWSSSPVSPQQYICHGSSNNSPLPPDVTISAPLDGSRTNNTQFSVSGAGLETGSTVHVSVSGTDNQSCSTSTNLGGGAWSCTLAGNLTGGADVALAVSAKQVDSNLNTSLNVATVSITLDTVAPTAPFIVSPSNGSTIGNGNITVWGTGETNANVTVTVDSNAGVCSDPVDGSVQWSCTPNQTFSNANYTLRAIQTDVAGNVSPAGTVNVTVAPPQWSHQAYLKAPNAEPDDRFGSSVSLDGDTALVSALGEDSNTTSIVHGNTASSDNSSADSGAVYVFKRSGSTWEHEAYLKAPNAQANDQFGSSVSLSGDTALVGAYGEDSSTTSIINGGDLSSTNNTASAAGAVYVFKRSGSTWAHEAYLKAPNADPSDRFGWSVSLSGDTAVVGSADEDSGTTTIVNGIDLSSTNNSATQSGAVYVFKRASGTWAHEAYLKAPNAEANDFFGSSVSVSGDTVLVGAWGEDSNTTIISNGTSASSNNSSLQSGAVYVFKRSSSTWAHEAYLKAPNTEANDQFGSSVSLSGDTALVGAYGEDSSTTSIVHGADLSSTNNTAISPGAAYVFKRSSGTWAHEAYLKAPNAESYDFFGHSVSVNGDSALVGAYVEGSDTTSIIHGDDLSSTNNSSPQSGAVYVFKRSGSIWTHQAYLKAPNADAADRFGSSVSLSGDTALVGVQNESSGTTSIVHGNAVPADNSALESGAVYVFKLQ